MSANQFLERLDEIRRAPGSEFKLQRAATPGDNLKVELRTRAHIDTSFTIPVMESLAPPHSHSLSAAEGWLELGNLAEARTELARIDESLQDHPQVLSARWAISAHEKNWPAALELARQLVRLAPESPFGWLHQAYAARRVPNGGLQAAWDCLLPALEKFPQTAIIPYNLACYACQLQQLEKARELFQRALKIGEKQHLKQIALEDADLQPLWAQIREL